MSFEANKLPLDEKERLCRSLLAEFGVTKVRKSNFELIHSCPLPFGLHRRGDVNPSAALNYEKLTFICHGGCGSGGLLWFIGTCRGSTSTQAHKWLTEQTATDETNLPQLLSYLDDLYNKPDAESRTPIPKMSEKILQPWMLIHPYLTEIRGISEDNIRRFRVGFNPETNRIVIPHFFNGALVGWQTRRLLQDGTPKYLSSPDNPKSETLFNFNPHEPVVVVEAPMTVVAKEHIHHLEATFGATVTDKQIRLLARHRRVILAFDNDRAGWRATRRVGEALQAYSEVYALRHPYAEDLGDLPDDEVLRLLEENRVPFALWSPPLSLHSYRKGVNA